MSRNLIFCDIGARDGMSEPWKYFRDKVDLVSFEPDQEEYDRLNAKKSGRDKIYKYALSNETKNVLFNLTRSRGCSSIYEPNRGFLDNFSDSKRFDVEKVVNVEATSLDDLNVKGKLDNIDFVKIDVQGSELDILKGGINFLRKNALGMEVEVEFQPMYKNQPLFSDVDNFIRHSFGFCVQDIKKIYWKYPAGIRVGGSKGQLVLGDALYFRSPYEIMSWCSEFDKKEALNKILMACLMGIVYGYLDYSLCLLKQPGIKDFVGADTVDLWVSSILKYGKSHKYKGRGSARLAYVFNILYRIFQPEINGWGSRGDCLGMRKKFGVFY